MQGSEQRRRPPSYEEAKAQEFGLLRAIRAVVDVAMTASDRHSSDRRGVTLPTLPASFPRAALGGSLPGLIDPTATAENDKITCSSTTIREGLNGSFSYDRLRLDGFQKYGTHFTTNSSDYAP